MRIVVLIGFTLCLVLGCSKSNNPQPPANNPVSNISDTDAAANQVSELAVSGTEVGIRAAATDPDGDSVSFSLTVDAGGRFGINSSTGVVVVAGSLDAESATSHSITVRALSGDGSSKTAPFTIFVTDENDNVPIYVGATAFDVPEGSINAGRAEFHDADVTSVLSYSISGGADSSILNINASNGVLTFDSVSDSNSPIDSNSDGTYEIRVSVTDELNTVHEDLAITVVPNAAPTGAIIFPPNGSLFSGRNIAVRGTASDADGDPMTVTVTINGVSETVEVVNGEWLTDNIPISESLIDLQIDAVVTDTYSTQTGSSNVEIDVSVPIIDPYAIALNKSSGFVYVADNFLSAILEINTLNGATRIIDQAGLFTGSNSSEYYVFGGISIDEAGNKVYYSNATTESLVEIDLNTGAKRIVANGFDSASFVSFYNGNLYLVDNVVGFDDFYEVNVSSGTRRLISGVEAGSGPEISLHRGIAINGATNQAIINGGDGIYSVDLATGSRVLISGGTPLVGAGSAFVGSKGVALDTNSNSIYTVTVSSGDIQKINLSNGFREILPNPNALILKDATDIEFLSGTNELIVSDRRLDAIFSVNAATGMRSLIRDYSVSSSYDFDEPTSAVFGLDNNTIYFNDDGLNDSHIYSLDVTSRQVNVVSSGGWLNGGFVGSSVVAFDSVNNRLFSSYGPIYEVDINSGVKTGFTGSTFGSGDMFFGSITEMAFSESTGLVVLTSRSETSESRNGLYTVNSAGVRDLISDAVIDPGIGISAGTDIIVNSSGDVVVSDDYRNEYIKSVDVSTGITSLISSGDNLGETVPEATAVAEAENPGEYYLLDGLIRRIYHVDSSGNRTVLSGSVESFVGEGGDIVLPGDLLYDPQLKVFYVTSAGWSSIFAVDRMTGHRVVIAK